LTTIALSTSNPARAKADAVVVGVTSITRGTKRGTTRGIRLAEGAAPVADTFDGDLRKALLSLGATGKAGEVHKFPSSGRVFAPVVIAVGLGPDAGDAEALRRAAGVASRSAAGLGSIVLALPAADAVQLDSVATGALLGAYAFLDYRKSSAPDHPKPVRAITVAGPAARTRAAQANVARLRHIARGVFLARDLVNTPSRDLTPADLAAVAVREGARAGIDVDVLDDRALRRGGFGGLIGVGQGSSHPPRLVRLAYRNPKATRHIALVGKGITFDSGGLSLKPPAGMEWMKADMGGAAAVLAALTAIARLKLPVNVTGWMALAENMPSGTAQRPSDVITIRGGKTVEVINTDAEGRLVLADAIVRAGEEHPDVIIDAATLTGAQMVALGSRTAGIMGNNDVVRSSVAAAAQQAGDAMWPMPLPEDLKSALESPIADLANLAIAGDRYGGMLAAGLFLAEFVPDGTPWVHLDIAGPAFNEGAPYGYTPRGGTGAAVRTFVEVADRLGRGVFAV
jgi:leucyl aminopeptidase